MSIVAQELPYRRLFDAAMRAGAAPIPEQAAQILLGEALDLVDARYGVLAEVSGSGIESCVEIACRAGVPAILPTAVPGILTPLLASAAPLQAPLRLTRAALAVRRGTSGVTADAPELNGCLLAPAREGSADRTWLLAVLDKVQGEFDSSDAALLGELARAAEVALGLARFRQRASSAERKRDEERLRYALEGSNDGLWDWDIQGHAAFHSPRYREILGLAQEAEIGSYGCWVEDLHPDDVAAALAKLDAMLAGQTDGYSAEYRIRSRVDGSWIWVLDRGKVVERDQAGRPLRAVGTLSDMTQRKRDEERHRYVIEASNDALWDWDVVTGEIYRNDRYFALRGYQPDELPPTYQSWEEAVHPDDLPELMQHLSRHMTGDTPSFEAEYRLRMKSGDWVWVSERAKIVERAPDGRPLRMVGAQLDVTARRETEEQLRAQKERLKAALTASRTGTYRWDIPTNRLTRDENMVRLLGHGEATSADGVDRFFESTLQQSYDRIHPDDRERVRSATEQCLNHRQDLQLDYRIVLPNGAIRWVAEKGTLICNPAGVPLYMTGACTDITDRKIAEEELAQSRDRAESANRAKSEFLANMSHELRTPLNAVIGFSDAMLNGYAGDLTPKQAEYVADINASGEHLLAIVNDVLDLSKVEAGKLELFCERVALSDALSVCVGLMQGRADSAGIDLEVDLPTGSLTVWADELRLRQILLNILSNAVKFTPTGGRVVVSARQTTGEVRVSVADTGIGMKPADVALALQPFSQVDGSLARRFEGTGLGLPLVKLLTELHGGTLEIETGLGVGTTVGILLPRQRPQHQGQAA